MADPDFDIRLQIQSVRDELPLASVRCIAKAMHTAATIVFDVPTEVLGLRFWHWRLVPQLLSDDRTADRAW
jgi:hypothetical protein